MPLLLLLAVTDFQLQVLHLFMFNIYLLKTFYVPNTRLGVS